MTTNLKLNELYLGDCLHVVGDPRGDGEAWPDACVDLIYLDPPFNSKRNYNTVFENELKKHSDAFSQARAFTDTWKWGGDDSARITALKNARKKPVSRAMRALHEFHGDSGDMSYLLYMAERLHLLHRVLKPTGALYLHCDPTMSHSLKLILDAIFGKENFRNEIVWCYRGMPTKARQFQKKHDTIFFYAKSGAHNFNPLRDNPAAGSKKTYESGKRVGYIANHKRMMVTVFDRAKYEAAVASGKIPSGMYEKDFSGGRPLMSDWWKIKILGGPKNKERLGYATQKPVKLLKRIISASSNPGDLVLDPFCGCGTTIAAAYALKRDWIGIDISSRAVEMVKKRMKTPRIPINGHPLDMASARQLSAGKGGYAKFEEWAVTRIPGFIANDVKTGDGGIDGEGVLQKAPDSGDYGRLCIAQVKSGKVTPDNLRAFAGILDAKRLPFGVFIAMSGDDYPPQVAKEVTDKCGTIKFGANQYDRLKLYSVEQYFNDNMRVASMPPMLNPDDGKAFQDTLPQVFPGE